MINNDYTILKRTICNNLYTSKPALNINFDFHLFVVKFPFSPMQVDPKFLRNMRFAKKHNRQGLKRQRKEQQEPMEPWLLVVDWVFAIIIYNLM